MTAPTTLLAPETPTRSALGPVPGSPPSVDRARYREMVAFRWYDEPLKDARRNFRLFEEHRAELEEIVRPYLRDNWCEDMAGKCRNPDGTLTGWLWKCTEVQENWWIWDFCNHYQRCHLRRGILQYCHLLIEQLQTPQTEDALGLWANAEVSDAGRAETPTISGQNTNAPGVRLH
jgi:hypothetical protein